MIKFTKTENFIALFYILLSIFLGAIAYGINSVALPANLIKHDVSPFLIGMATAIEIWAGVKISFILSKIIARLSIIRAAVTFGAIYCVSIALIFFYQNFYLWAFFCALNGACWFSLFVIRNAWINRLVSNHNRSVILATTTTVFCGGFAFGSTIIKYLGAYNYSSFLISSSLIFISILSLILIKRTAPTHIDSDRIGIYEFFKHNPLIALAKFLLDLQNGCLIALTVIFGVKIGLTPENAGLLLAAFMASGFCDLYAGFLVRKYNRYKMIILGFCGCLTMILLMTLFYQNFYVLILLYFLFGASTASIFVSTLTITNETFSHEKLIAANATFQSIGSLGSVLGAVLGGIFIEYFGFRGFFIAIILSNLLYLIYVFYEKNKTRS